MCHPRPQKKLIPFIMAEAAAAVILIAALITFAWIGSARVWAGVQRIFGMVPGIGLIDQEEYSNILIAAEPVCLLRESPLGRDYNPDLYCHLPFGARKRQCYRPGTVCQVPPKAGEIF